MSNKFRIKNGLIYTDGNQSSGYVLTSDASGNATWQPISSGISTNVTYTNLTPTPVTQGGISVGSTFTGQTMQQMWDKFLYPYQFPAFTSISNVIFSTYYEIGQLIPSGLTNITYTVSNPTNIKSPQPPNVGVPSTNIPSTTFPVNPFQLLASGTFGITIPTSATSVTPTTWTISCQGTNSNNNTFTGSNSLSFSFRNYWGFNANTTLLAADILNLQSSQLKSGFAGTYVMPSNATPRYLYFAYPASFGYPTTIFDNTNGFNATADFQNNGTITAPNQYGVSILWQVIRSVNATAGAGGYSYTLS